MKKIIILLTCIMLVISSFAFTGCKKSKGKKKTTSSVSSVSDLSETSDSSDSGDVFVPLNADKYVRVDKDGNESENGEYILFGSYPQSQTLDVPSVFDPYVENKPDPAYFNENTKMVDGWINYEYYAEGSNDTAYMWYKDLEYLGQGYRAVYFSSYRPYWTTESGTEEHSYQDVFYTTGQVYWFKFEPIMWRIMQEGSGKATLVAELILDAQPYQNTWQKENDLYYNNNADVPENTYANSYEYSTIRQWLNDSFYKTAFTELERDIIQVIEVNNTVISTNPSGDTLNDGTNIYISNFTNDKVWLLSEQEVTTVDYGFNGDVDANDGARLKKTSQYARCQGVYTYVNTASPYHRCGWWWLRSPYYDASNFAFNCGYEGESALSLYVNMTGGIVPAICIVL